MQSEGMRSIIVDCGAVRTEADFWSAYVGAVDPEGVGYFGRNLDAFWDGLNGGPGWPGECTLKFIHTQALHGFREGLFMEALREIASQSTLVQVIFE